MNALVFLHTCKLPALWLLDLVHLIRLADPGVLL